MAVRNAACSPLVHQLRSAARSVIAAEGGAARGLSDVAHGAAAATRLPADGLTLQDFIRQSRSPDADLVASPASTSAAAVAAERTVCIETYGW